MDVLMVSKMAVNLAAVMDGPKVVLMVVLMAESMVAAKDNKMVDKWVFWWGC